MMIKRLLALLALPLLVLCTACSPSDVVHLIVGTQATGQGYQIEAKKGAVDGGGPLFASQVVCEGENFWRPAASWTNVDNAPNAGPTRVIPENHWFSIVWCPPGKRVIITNVLRSQS